MEKTDWGEEMSPLLEHLKPDLMEAVPAVVVAVMLKVCTLGLADCLAGNSGWEELHSTLQSMLEQLRSEQSLGLDWPDCYSDTVPMMLHILDLIDLDN